MSVDVLEEQVYSSIQFQDTVELAAVHYWQIFLWNITPTYLLKISQFTDF